MKKFLYVTMLLASLAIFMDRAGAQVIVIANPSVNSNSVTKGELSDVFTGASTRLKDGSRVKPVVLKEGATHSEFLSNCISKSPAVFLITWRSLLLSGQGTMPKTLETEPAMVEYVARTPGAIGYVKKTTAHEGVKVLALQ